MISEFQELSEKIEKLAELTQSLRSENYLLRQANALLAAENVDFKNRLLVAQHRLETLLAQLDPPAPAEPPADAADTTDDKEAAR